MVKSTLNSIGGGILYIPYDPEFMLNTAKTGYSDYADKYLPHVVISGGITEFDRGLVTKGENLDGDWSRSFNDELYGIDASDRDKHSLAKITLDFNLIDFKTFTGIPKMQTTNTIKVHKGVSETGLGFTVYGASFGMRGSIKKVQGRHAAVRLLVQASVIQLLGRHQKLPYWRLVPGAKSDPVVLQSITRDFYTMPEHQRVTKIQHYLYLHGYDVTPNGVRDSATNQALASYGSKNSIAATVDATTYRNLFETVPLDFKARSKQVYLTSNQFVSKVKPATLMARSKPAFRVLPNTQVQPKVVPHIQQPLQPKVDPQPQRPIYEKRFVDSRPIDQPHPQTYIQAQQQLPTQAYMQTKNQTSAPNSILVQQGTDCSRASLDKSATVNCLLDQLQ
jgi:hypothetical protein